MSSMNMLLCRVERKAIYSRKNIITYGFLIDVICNYFKVTDKDLYSKNRKPKIVNCRIFIINFAKEFVRGFTVESVSSYLGYADHTSAVHHIKNFKGYIEVMQDPYFTDYKNIKKILLDIWGK